VGGEREREGKREREREGGCAGAPLSSNHLKKNLEIRRVLRENLKF
jgi:hypothetical protein